MFARMLCPCAGPCGLVVTHAVAHGLCGSLAGSTHIAFCMNVNDCLPIEPACWHLVLLHWGSLLAIHRNIFPEVVSMPTPMPFDSQTCGCSCPLLFPLGSTHIACPVHVTDCLHIRILGSCAGSVRLPRSSMFVWMLCACTGPCRLPVTAQQVANCRTTVVY